MPASDQAKEKDMNRHIFKGIAALCICAFAANNNAITPTERERALQYLTESRDGVIGATKGLSEAQWKFKPAPDRWSVAEVVEHLALIEQYFVENVRAQLEKSPAAPGRDSEQIDASILIRMPDRFVKAKAPALATPTGRWTPEEALNHFLTARAETVEYLKSGTDLRAHTVTHPAFGPLDGYEWVLAMAAHSERHTKQILEVKADQNFPAK
jgi:hypothetical protein